MFATYFSLIKQNNNAPKKFTGIEFPKEETKEVETFTLEEVGNILKALESEPWHIRAVIEVALFTGCRRGEIVGLKWAYIDSTGFATQALAKGCDIKTVSSRLGHADITTTNIYVHALENTDRMAAQTFDNFLRKNNV